MLDTVDTHTAGMPTRVLTGGLDWASRGETVREQRERFRAEHDWVREVLMQEPRGHHDMYGALRVPPADGDADFGVFYFDPHKYSNMCGHGTMGVVTALVETGQLEPQDRYRIETPAGLVDARPRLAADGQVTSVAVRNVESYVCGTVTVDDDEFGRVAVEVVQSGNVLGLVDVSQFGLDVTRENVERFRRLGQRLRRTVNERGGVDDPLTGEPATVMTMEFYQPRDGADRNIVISQGGLFDRSPCGTGTCAKMTLLHGRGELGLDEDYDHESVIGTRFQGRLRDSEVRDGVTVTTPEVEGSAHIISKNTFLHDPEDPLTGFVPS